MYIREIQEFQKIRKEARAYFCYLFSKNIPNRLPSLSEEMIVPRLVKMKADLENCEGVYLLDYKGVQISKTYTQHEKIEDDVGKIRANRAYYYRAVREERCTITDPYPSLLTGELTVTASSPIFDEKGVLKYVACLDMPLSEVLNISHFNKTDNFFLKLFKYSYGAFSFALIAVAMVLFFHGVEGFAINGLFSGKLQVEYMFKSTILLTLSLAIFDLAKTLIEEEVLGQEKEHHISGPHKTMVKFIGSIIIALSIESLMLVFKFAIIDPDKLLYAIFIMGGVSVLLVSLAIYIKFTKLKIEE